MKFRRGVLIWTEDGIADPQRRRIEFTLVEGDLDALDGSWQVEAAADGSLIRFACTFDMGIPTLAHLLGLTPALARVLDTGPSAATTAVGACLLIAARMNRGAALLSLGLLIAAAAAPGVDGIEHTTSLVWGLLAGALYVVVTSRTRSTGASTAWKTRIVGILRAFRSPRSALAGMRDRD